MAAVSLSWDTNMAAVTSCENTLKYLQFDVEAGKESVFTCYATEVFVDDRGENFGKVENGQRNF